MTVTLLIEQRKVRVDNSQLQGSELVENVVSDLGQEDVDISVPPRYLPVIDIYLDFISKISYDKEGEVIYPANLLVISNIDDLFLCFFMETFFEDNSFFVYLMDQAYSIWNEFYPTISLLPDERLVYLYTPYELVPEEYMDKEGFFKEWLQINANKNIILNGNKVYRTIVNYYPKGQIKEFNAYYTIGGTKTISHDEGWYESPQGQPKYRRSYKNGQQDGLQECWYADGQAMYRDNYKDGKQDGPQERWYADGQAMYRHIYKDGKQDGLWEAWYTDGQDKYRDNYKDGKEDGLQEGWYADGQLWYRRLYDMGMLIKEETS